MALYFNVENLRPSYEYVLWIDIMGTKNFLLESDLKAANYICKFHAAVLGGVLDKPSISLYPMMDGVYITCPDFNLMIQQINHVFIQLSELLLASNDRFSFLVRGSLAYGPVYHGKNIEPEMNRLLATQKNYSGKILVGLPLEQAYKTEHLAPPMGVYVHESARSPRGMPPLKAIWQRWFWKVIADEKIDAISKKVCAYFDFCQSRIIESQYDQTRLKLHRNMFEEYFVHDYTKKAKREESLCPPTPYSPTPPSPATPTA
ncbi:MAG: hypothetical protein LBN04_02270 [Oscillospiraceae bacterium]|jgi:hypothetical protein|nr:hypothetical protein [Oscillospiraceae bacterium]